MKTDLDRAWARAAAMIGRSYLGGRFRELLACRNLGGLAALALPGMDADLPDHQLVARIQRGIDQRCLADSLQALDVTVDGLLSLPFRIRESRWLRWALAERVAGRDLPLPPELGGWASLRTRRWPDLAEMLRGTPWAWVPAAAEAEDLPRIGLRLEAYCRQAMRAAMAGRPAEDTLRRVLAREAGLAQEGAVLRRRFLDAAAGGHASDSVPDPAAFERQVQAWLAGAFWNLFHAQPLGEAALYAFCRLKELEAGLVGSVAEGLVLGIGAEGMASLQAAAGGAA